MSLLILVGRILYALIFVGSGFGGHLAQTDATAGYGQMRGLPNAKLLTQVSGVLIAAGGLGVALGIWGDLAALGLALFSLIAAFMVHHFWTDEDEMTKTMEMSMFMKNLALVGGGIALFALFGLLGDDIGFSITGPIFELEL